MHTYLRITLFIDPKTGEVWHEDRHTLYTKREEEPFTDSRVINGQIVVTTIS